MKPTNKNTKEQSVEVENANTSPDIPIVMLDRMTLAALRDIIAKEVGAAMAVSLKQLNRALILHARLCAADTVRTAERADSVFRHAIKEAEIAVAEIKKHFTPAQGSSK